MSTPSVREQILEHLSTLLSAATGFTFYRSREAPVQRAEGVVGILLPAEEEVEYKATHQTLRTLVVKIIVIGRADVADQIADPAAVAVHAAIMQDQTLGGLCGLIIDESTQWNFEVADRNAVEIEMRYRIKYSTQVADLTAPA